VARFVPNFADGPFVEIVSNASEGGGTSEDRQSDLRGEAVIDPPGT
jgi:hypothetical protein